MAIDTKPNLDYRKFEQFTGDTLKLSGSTIIYGDIEFAGSAPVNPTNQTLASRGFVTGITSNKLDTSVYAAYTGATDTRITAVEDDVTFLGTLSGSTQTAVQTANNGLTKSGTNIRLGGTLTGNTQIAGGGFYLNLGSSASKLNVLSATTTGQQIFKTDTVGASFSAAGFQFVDNTDVNASRYVASFVKRSSTGTPNVNNAGQIAFVMPDSALTEKVATDFNYGFSPTTAGGETSYFDFRGLYTGSSTNYLRVGLFTALGLGSQVVGAGDIAIGTEAKAWNSTQVALGYRAAKTSGSATGRLSAISIGASANAGSQSIGNYSIAVGNFAKARSGDTISIGRNAGNTTGVAGDGAISIGANANQGSTNQGTNSIAIGRTTKTVGDNSIAIGNNVQLTDTGSNIGIGSDALAGGGSGVAVGSSAQSTATEATAIGSNSRANTTSASAFGFLAGNNSGSIGIRHVSLGAYSNNGSSGIGQDGIGIGFNSNSRTTQSIAIGYTATASGGTDNIAIGTSTKASNQWDISIGNSTVVNGGGGGSAAGIGIGGFAISTGTSATAIGYFAHAGGVWSNAIGRTARTKAVDQISIGTAAGNTTGATGAQAISIGRSANQGSDDIGQDSIAIGYLSKSRSQNSISIGASSGIATGTVGHSAISIGVFANNSDSANIGQQSVALGYNPKASLIHSIAIGSNAYATGGTSPIAIGLSTRSSGISIGELAGNNTTGATGAQAISIGYYSNQGAGNAIGLNSVAIGRETKTKTAYGIAIGYQAGFTTGTDNGTAVSIGYQANHGTAAIGGSSISIGNSSESNGSFSIGIGYQAIGKSDNAISIGNGAGSSSGTISNTNISIGQGANAGTANVGNSSIAIGFNTRSTATGAILLSGVNSGTITNSIANSFGLAWGAVTTPDYHLIKGTLTTTNSTQGTLLSYTLLTGSTYSLVATVTARQTDGTDRAMYIIKTLAYREAGGAVIEGSLPYIIEAIESTNAAVWDATMDASSNDIRVRVTGNTGETINWHVILQITKVS